MRTIVKTFYTIKEKRLLACSRMLLYEKKKRASLVFILPILYRSYKLEIYLCKAYTEKRDSSLSNNCRVLYQVHQEHAQRS